ncbi:MAG: MBG domain-containing protein, partial [Xanthobacteraceae bacterium]
VLDASSVGGDLTVVSSLGDLTQSGALTVGGTSSFTTAATNGTITLTNTGNLLTGAVALSTSGTNGHASLTNANATVLAASALGGNLTVRTDVVSVTGAINASGHTVTLFPLTATTTIGLGTGSGTLSLGQAALNNITAATLVFGSTGSNGAMTLGGTVALPSSITSLSLLSGSTITIASGSLSDANPSSSLLLQGASLALNGSVSVNGANSVLTLNATGTATQSAAITATNLALLGNGGSYSLNNAGNLIGTLAANTGSVSLTNAQALTIGTVSGTVGWTTAGNSALTTAGGLSHITVSTAASWSGSTLTLSAGGNLAINASMTGGTAGDLMATANGSVTIAASAVITGKTVALAAAGAFINNRGSDAISASDRWLIYSNAPDAPGQNFGNLNSNNTAIWNNTYATLPPASVTLAGNRYIFAFAPGGRPATLTVTSLNDSKTYGSTANLSRFAVSGFQAGVPNAYLPDADVYGGTPAFSSAGASAVANAGTYAITVSQGSLVASSGYRFAFSDTGVLTVNPAALIVTATNATRTYDKVAFSGGGVTYSGFVNGEDASVLSGTLAYAGTSQGAVNAGTYTIIPSSLTSSNYVIDYVAGTLTINKALITVMANSQTKFIGSPDPPLTYSVTNGTLFGGDSLSGGLVRAAGESLGPYPITRGTLASPNYDLTFVGSTLFIEANPAGVIAPSSAISTANTLPASPVSTTYNAVLPSAALAINTGHPQLRIVRTRNGNGILLEPVAQPQRYAPAPARRRPRSPPRSRRATLRSRNYAAHQVCSSRLRAPCFRANLPADFALAGSDAGRAERQ